jgi:methyl-accepting chemotaxis protein
MGNPVSARIVCGQPFPFFVIILKGMESMTIRAKILGGFIIATVLGLILGTIGLVATSTLTSMSDELYEMQSTSATITEVLNAHYQWRQSVTISGLTGTEFTGALDPTACALGKWRNSAEAQSITDPEVIALLQQVDDPHAFIHTQAKNLVALIEAGDTAGAEREVIDVLLPRTEEVISTLAKMETRYSEITEEKSAEIVAQGNLLKTITIVVAILSLAACALCAWKITESIMNPLRKITAASEAIAIGDLDVSVSYPVNDQIGQLAQSFQKLADNTKAQVAAAEILASGDLSVAVKPRSDKDMMSFAMIRMINSLNEMFANIQATSVQVAGGSKQLADGAQSLAQGSTEQAATIEELSAAISSLTDKTSRNTKIAREAAELSGNIRSNAEKGSTQMDEMIRAVREISDASGQISRVIKVIDDIAFQTNILALNAAVEAARAGQHGKGFAVVADEVRNLAAKSAEAAKDTSGLIEDSIEKANIGLQIAVETGDSLKDIVEGINRSAEIVTQIADASDEQAGAIGQIDDGINQVARVVQQNSATAEQSAAASEEMSGQSELLEQLIDQFKLRDSSHQPRASSSPRPAARPSPQTAAFALSGK